METPDLPSHAEVSVEIAGLQLGVDAAELHGSLCGFLSAGGVVGREDWLRRLELETEPVLLAGDGALDRLYRASQAQLADPDLGFGLLLPEDDASVSERAEALLGWCRGFLGGFGLVLEGAGPTLAHRRDVSLRRRPHILHHQPWQS